LSQDFHPIASAIQWRSKLISLGRPEGFVLPSLLGDDPSGLSQRNCCGHPCIRNFQDGTGRQAIDIAAPEHFRVPSQQSHEHLVERHLHRQTHHGDLARRIAGLNLDFFASRLTTVRGAGFGPVGRN
jgi:hypothetical protein